MRTIATMIHEGRYKVMYDDKAKRNPYKVYYLSGSHQTLLERWADLESAMRYLTDIIHYGKDSVTVVSIL